MHNHPEYYEMICECFLAFQILMPSGFVTLITNYMIFGQTRELYPKSPMY